MSALGSRVGGGASPAAVTPTPQQAQGMITRNQHSRSTPSNLALVMKLAEPGGGGGAGRGGGGRGAGGSSGGGSGGGGGGGAPRDPGPDPAPDTPRPPDDGSPDRIIYF